MRQAPRRGDAGEPDQDGCAVVSLHATHAQPKPGSIRLDGTYCLVGAGTWRENSDAPLQRWLLERSELARRLDRREDPYAELPLSTEH